MSNDKRAVLRSHEIRFVWQRYANRMAYAKAVALAARELRDQGLLLQEDVDRYIERARIDTRVAP